MKTPICDFVNSYNLKKTLRLHMPGHKGISTLGCEGLDITEIDGADSLYEAQGIIRESEINAGTLFGANTYYSTEGSSLCIRAMLYLTALYAKHKGERTTVLAGRNAHKTFLSVVALLDIDVEWLYPEQNSSYVSCPITAGYLEKIIIGTEHKPTAVYVTSPDYLGNVLDLAAISAVCRKYGILLLVDNAHGAYLKFLYPSRHPIDSGADMCCDSAHKTLPVLTGGAYLHISHSAPEMLVHKAKDALALFGSTSPSYLILQSLDCANRYISLGYPKKLTEFIVEVEKLKVKLRKNDYDVLDSEQLKITLKTTSYGYSGIEFSQILSERNITCEFCDPDFVVFMLTPEIGSDGLKMLEAALLAIPEKQSASATAPTLSVMKKVLSVREAMLSPSEVIPAQEAVGRILALPSVSCPPAVPIAVPGEELSAQAVETFKYYGIKNITVVK